jgi:hypothetical protein
MTVPGLEKYSRQRRLEAYLRNRYDAFLYKAFRTVSRMVEILCCVKLPLGDSS